tara:strand:- start:547 stop:699 length:153 start_codon:yes stop_codon:yes gene_type:complete
MKLKQKFKKEWSLFKKDIKKLTSESRISWINWYVLKPLLLVLCIIALIIL